MPRLPRTLIPLALLALQVAPVAAQTGQYTAPGALGVHPVDAREALQSAVDEARWRIGPVRLDPWIGVREIAWVEEQDQDGDLTISVGAGLRAYLPVGSRVTLTAHTLPEYIWWRERTDERRLGGRAGLGLFYYANRLGLEIKASSSDLTDYVTPEVQRRTRVDNRALSVRLDVPIGGRIALFVRGDRRDWTIAEDDPGATDLAGLDRLETTFEGGLRLSLTRDLWLGVGAGQSETEFDDAARALSNDGDYTMAELGWSRAKLAASVVVRWYSLSGTSTSSEFVEFDESTWRAQVSWQPRARLSLAVYGQEDLVYSVETPDAYFLDQRVGLRVGLPVSSRLGLSAFVEEGEHDYASGLRDDVRSWGGFLDLALTRRLHVSIGTRTTELDGDLGRREVSELLFRASLGTEGLSWE